MTTEIQDAIGYLDILLEQRETLTTEPHLQPLHLVAIVPLDGTVQASLTRQLRQWNYQPDADSNLLLSKLADWKSEIAEAPFFSSGFKSTGGADDADVGLSHLASARQNLKVQFFQLLLSVVSPNVNGYRLANYDSARQPLFPHGGLHDSFVLVESDYLILIDFGWDS